MLPRNGFRASWLRDGIAPGLLLCVATAAAATRADAAPPPPPEVLYRRALGVLETNPLVTGRDGAYSTRVRGMSVWVYGDTALSSPGVDGGNWRHNTLSWTRDLYAPDFITGFADQADAIGAPVRFIPLTSEEIDYNARHHGDACQEAPCNYEYGHWPAALLYDAQRDRVLFTYGKMLLGPGAWNFASMGTGIAVGTGSMPTVLSRPVVRPTAPDPTLLFDAGEPGFLNAAFIETVAGVPTAYFYDCSGGDGFTKPMHVARVPVADVLDRTKWRFWSADGTWSASLANLAVVFDGADQLSVHWNDFLDAYIAVYVQPLTTQVVARVASRPEGPWSATTLLFDALPPVDGGLDYCGMAHLEYQRDGGRFETISYVRDTGPFLAERRVSEIEFARRVEANDRDADYDSPSGVMLSDASYPNQVCMGMDQHDWRQMSVQFPLRVPPSATITSASVELRSSGQNSGSFTSTIRSIAQDDIAPYLAGNPVPFTSAYPLSAAGVGWTAENAGDGTTVATPELRALVQEVVDRPGWQRGQHLGFVFPETQTRRNIRCFRDAAGGSGAAALRLGYYAHGTPVCLDARSGVDRLMVTPVPAPGCIASLGGTLEFVFGRLGAVRLSSGTVDLGPVRCAGPGNPTTEQVVRSADPDQPPGDGSFYFVRVSGAADFGRAQLSDGTTPARLPGPSNCP